jgi:hypothetical protein
MNSISSAINDILKRDRMDRKTPPSHAHRHERHDEVVVYEMNRIQLILIFGFKVKKDF